MSSSINLNTRQSAFSLSNERAARMMSGDKQTATHMGLWDRFKDLFRSEKKQDALNALFDLVNSQQGPARSFHVFNQLAQMAAPDNRTLFTVALTSDLAGCKASYCISGHPVRTEQVSPEEREVMLARLGVPPGGEHVLTQASSLDDCRLEITPHQLNALRDADFGAGGVHKRFHAATGVLQARDNIGREDFVRESRLQEYAESRPDLQHYISTQRQIDAPPGVSDKFAYARCPCTTPRASPAANWTRRCPSCRKTRPGAWPRSWWTWPGRFIATSCPTATCTCRICWCTSAWKTAPCS